MPQFDFYSFFSQIFWVCIFSFLIYFIYLKYSIKNLSEVFKGRSKINLLVVSLTKKITSASLYQQIISKKFLR